MERRIRNFVDDCSSVLLDPDDWALKNPVRLLKAQLTELVSFDADSLGQMLCARARAAERDSHARLMNDPSIRHFYGDALVGLPTRRTPDERKALRLLRRDLKGLREQLTPELRQLLAVNVVVDDLISDLRVAVVVPAIAGPSADSETFGCIIDLLLDHLEDAAENAEHGVDARGVSPEQVGAKLLDMLFLDALAVGLAVEHAIELDFEGDGSSGQFDEFARYLRRDVQRVLQKGWLGKFRAARCDEVGKRRERGIRQEWMKAPAFYGPDSRTEELLGDALEMPQGEPLPSPWHNWEIKGAEVVLREVMNALMCDSWDDIFPRPDRVLDINDARDATAGLARGRRRVADMQRQIADGVHTFDG